MTYPRGDEWTISIEDLAARIGETEDNMRVAGFNFGRRSLIALRTILDARVQLEAAERLGVAAVRADEAAIQAAQATREAAEATKRAADAADGTRKATIALFVATALLAAAAVMQLLVSLHVLTP